MRYKTKYATRTAVHEKRKFLLFEKSDLREARALSACARSNFPDKGAGLMITAGDRAPQSALGACARGISAWLKIGRQCANPAVRLEAWNALGDLYYLRGLACKKSQELDLREASPGLLFVRMGGVFEKAIRYWEKSLKEAKPGGRHTDAPPNYSIPLKNNILYACDEAAFAYQRASIQLMLENALPGGLETQMELRRRGKNIESYEKKVDILLGKSVRLFMSFHWDSDGSLKFSRVYGEMGKPERVILNLFEKHAKSSTPGKASDAAVLESAADQTEFVSCREFVTKQLYNNPGSQALVVDEK